MLSWLTRLNFGVKIAKWTPFGELRGTKWALGGPLERPSGPQERFKKAKMGGVAVLGNEQVTGPTWWGEVGDGVNPSPGTGDKGFGNSDSTRPEAWRPRRIIHD